MSTIATTIDCRGSDGEMSGRKTAHKNTERERTQRPEEEARAIN